jgi:hypothetical protein
MSVRSWGIAMPKSKASFGDVIGAVTAAPMQAARITYLSFFRPTSVYTDVELGERTALIAALTYWTTILGVLAGLNIGLPAFLGYDMSFVSALGSNTWTKLIDVVMGSAIAQQVFQIVMFLVIVLLWYLMLRIFSRKRRIGVVAFMHSTIYPWASLQILGYVVSLSFLVFVMTAAIDERAVPASPIQCNNVSNYFCRTIYVYDQYPSTPIVFSAAIYIPMIWSWAAISVILKDKTGIRKRVTLGALAALGAVYVIAMGGLGVALAILNGR